MRRRLLAGYGLLAAGLAGLAFCLAVTGNTSPFWWLDCPGEPLCVAAALSYYAAAAGLAAAGLLVESGFAATAAGYTAAAPLLVAASRIGLLDPLLAKLGVQSVPATALLFFGETVWLMLGLGAAAASTAVAGLPLALVASLKTYYSLQGASLPVPETVNPAGHTVPVESLALLVASLGAAYTAATAQPTPAPQPPPPSPKPAVSPPQPPPAARQQPVQSQGAQEPGRLECRHTLAELASGDPKRVRRVLEDCLVGREVYGYRVEKLLGIGGFGAVLLGRKRAGQIVDLAALKLLLPRPLKSGGSSTVMRGIHEYLEELRRETANLMELSERSPYIVRLKAIHVEPDIVKQAIRYQDLEAYLSSPPVIAMEYMAGGSLEDLMEKARRRGEAGLNRETWVRLVAAVAAAAARALADIHQAGYVHSDVKPENILFTSQPSDTQEATLRELLEALQDPGKARLIPKLSDLGSAVRVGERLVSASPVYGDYEVRLCFLTGDPAVCGSLTAHPGRDMFSLAATIIAALHAHLRSEERQRLLSQLTVNAGGRLQLNRSLLNQRLRGLEPLASLLEAMMSEDPAKRPRADRVAKCLECLASTPTKNWAALCRAECTTQPREAQQPTATTHS